MKKKNKLSAEEVRQMFNRYNVEGFRVTFSGGVTVTVRNCSGQINSWKMIDVTKEKKVVKND